MTEVITLAGGDFTPSTTLVTCDQNTVIGDGSLGDPLRAPGATVRNVVVATPYVARANELVLVDTISLAITVNAPSSMGAPGEHFTVKDVGANANVNAITISPVGLEIVENPTINNAGGSKTWTSDGLGNWWLTSVV